MKPERYMVTAVPIGGGERVTGQRLDIGGYTYIVYGGYVSVGGTPYITNHVQVDPATIGQCTGLRDKNGTLIFEGDICKDSLGWTFKVLWDEENARFLGHHSKPRGDTYICYVGREPPVEIIGNIWGNLELPNEGVR